MPLNILAQNTLDAFSNLKTANDYIALIDRIGPDVAVLPEAYDATRPEPVDKAVQRLAQLGYEVLSGPYDETDGRKDQHGIMLLIRKALVDPKRPSRLVRVGTHNIAEGWVLDPASRKRLHVFGVHLNDRSEARRQAELDDLLGMLTDDLTIVAGDLNSLYKSDARGKEFRRAWLIHLLTSLKVMPVHDPTGKPMPNSLGRTGSVYRRLHEMASGKTLERLLAAGFTDADPDHHPTLPASGPFAQLDHIMLSSELRVSQFEVLLQNSSDHRGIVATIEV